MSLLDKLERKLRRFAVPNITLYLILGQVFFYMASMTGRFDILRIVLIPDLVLAGEWWRLITFIFIPPFTNPLFIFFVWYLYYLMGTALEGHWGAFRYNLFLLIGYIFTVTASFLIPASVATNVFFFGSVILAFAALYPEFQLYILFILPVKMKWLALIPWIGYAISIIFGTWQTRFLVIASIGNFFLFFGRDIIWKVKTGRQKMASQVREISGSKEAFHRCTVCGVTDRSDPKMEFRYCPECGGLGYCKDHILNHVHVKK